MVLVKLIKWMGLVPLGMGIVLLFFALVWRAWGQAMFGAVLIALTVTWIGVCTRLERHRRRLRH